MADRTNKHKHTGPRTNYAQTIPFETVEEAWFWFIAAQAARNDGARIAAAMGVTRPCEPIDILKILDDLYRNRRLIRDHFLVLRYYGVRNMPPDPRRPKEIRAARLWKEALERIEPVMIRKGIVRKIEGDNIVRFQTIVSSIERMAAE